MKFLETIEASMSSVDNSLQNLEKHMNFELVKRSKTARLHCIMNLRFLMGKWNFFKETKNPD